LKLFESNTVILFCVASGLLFISHAGSKGFYETKYAQAIFLEISTAQRPMTSQAASTTNSSRHHQVSLLFLKQNKTPLLIPPFR